MSVIVFDIEAAAKRGGQICQLAYLIVDGERIVGRNMFFSVAQVSESAYEVHHMSAEMLRVLSEGAVFADRVQEILRDFEEADLLIGHNVSADVHYLNCEFERLQMPPVEKPTFCTMNYFTPRLKLRQRVKWSRSPKPPKLQELTGHFSLTEEAISEKARLWFGGGAAAHDARYDAAATLLCVLEGIRRGEMEKIL